MKLSLLLRAADIPDDTKVRKPQGSTWFTLRRGLSIRAEDGKQMYLENDCLYLIGDRAINVVSADRMLAVDFDDLRDLRDFVEIHLEVHQ